MLTKNVINVFIYRTYRPSTCKRKIVMKPIKFNGVSSSDWVISDIVKNYAEIVCMEHAEIRV